MTKETIINNTKTWLREIVIGLRLCPFAFEVYNGEKINYLIVDFDSAESLVQTFLSAVEEVLDTNNAKTTALLVFPEGLGAFEDYLMVFNSMEDLLEKEQLSEDIQLASFHPEYQFAQTDKSDPSNYTNRSPYPIIHILKTADVTAAIEQHSDVHAIPDNNIKTMQALGLITLHEMWKQFHS